tara:strand:- start:69 stop:428 length:360 start_codon:yes stop_codon:yes gene_type:complete
MKEQLITFETAKLAKEKGFKMGNPHGFVSRFYNPKTKILLHYGRMGRLDFRECYSAPTQSLLQKWLRDTQNIHLESSLTMGFEHSFTCYQGLWYEGDTDDTSYEKALEEGLLIALNLIK